MAFFLSLVVLVLLLAINWRRHLYRPRLLDMVLVLCFLPLAAGSVRMVAWWLLATAPLATLLLVRLLPVVQKPENKPTAGAALTCAALVLLAVFSVPGLQACNPLLAFRPKDRVEDDLDAVLQRVSAHPGTGRIFTRFEWGDYFTWAADQRFTVFMDGRIEIFPDQVWKEYESITRGQDWQHLLDTYHVDAMVLDSDYHARTGLLEKVKASPAWVHTFESNTAQLYLRK